MRGAVAASSHPELHASSHFGFLTVAQDLLDGIVNLLGIVIVRISLMGCLVQSHMLAPQVWSHDAHGTDQGQP